MITACWTDTELLDNLMVPWVYARFLLIKKTEPQKLGIVHVFAKFFLCQVARSTIISQTSTQLVVISQRRNSSTLTDIKNFQSLGRTMMSLGRIKMSLGRIMMSLGRNMMSLGRITDFTW